MPAPAKGSSKTGSTTRRAAPSGAAKAPAARGERAANAGAIDALALLAADHRAVEHLFSEFEQASGDRAKRSVAIAICTALKVHARLEEEVFYPAVATALDDRSLIEEALVEHASARDLIAQIEAGAPGEPLFDARVMVLGEYVAHHVAEEEEEIFPLCRKSGVDLDALGELLAARKQELTLGFTVSNPILVLS